MTCRIERLVTEGMAVGFDLGDTLCEYAGVPLSWAQEYPAALAAVAEGCGLELSPERLGSGQRLLLRYNTRHTPRPDECEYTAEHIFRELLDEWTVPAELLERCIGSFFSHFRQKLRVFPDAQGAIEVLKARGIATGVLTDVAYGMPRHLVLADIAEARLPLAEDLVVTSTEAGHHKPHSAGFRLLAERLGVSSDRLVYVGNERKDVAGANAAGCQSVLLWRSTDEPPAWGQGHTIRSLPELLELLGVQS
jgi:putative hydrolase of the HAD superfamily